MLKARQPFAKSEITIANILSAAERVFVAKNYAEVTMDQIAEACEMTKGALYHHFASKENLYLAMMHSEFTRKEKLFTEIVESVTGCRERLRSMLKAFFMLPDTKMQLNRLVRRDINIFEEPARSELIRAYQASLPILAEQVIRDGIRDGELEPHDPRLLSWHYIAMVEVTLSRYANTVFDDTEAKLDHHLNLFFRGVGAADERRATGIVLQDQPMKKEQSL